MTWRAEGTARLRRGSPTCSVPRPVAVLCGGGGGVGGAGKGGPLSKFFTLLAFGAVK